MGALLTAALRAMCMYGHGLVQVMKEWSHNIEGNAFVLPSIIFVLFSYIEFDRDPAFAKVRRRCRRVTPCLMHAHTPASPWHHVDRDCLLLPSPPPPGKLRSLPVALPSISVHACMVCIPTLTHSFAALTRAAPQVLFWIGAPTSLSISIARVGSWIASAKEVEHVNAAWMIVPVGNFVSAMVGPMLDNNYRAPMQFWFAFAMIMWLALFAITLQRAITHIDYGELLHWQAGVAGGLCYLWHLLRGCASLHGSPLYVPEAPPPSLPFNAMQSCPPPTPAPLLPCSSLLFMHADDRARPVLAVWIAAPAVGAVAYLSCFYNNASMSAALAAGEFNDFIFLNMYWIAMALTFVLAWCFVLPFFGRIRFEMSYWWVLKRALARAW